MGSFHSALAGPGLAAIAEVKRRSPSAGDLRPEADPAALALAFQLAGAAAVSILVDERFGGSVDDLRSARRAASLPLLAKGFFRDATELAGLREAGADAVLLLLRDLDDGVHQPPRNSGSTRSSRRTMQVSSSAPSSSAPTRSGSTHATSTPSRSTGVPSSSSSSPRRAIG